MKTLSGDGYKGPTHDPIAKKIWDDCIARKVPVGIFPLVPHQYEVVPEEYPELSLGTFPSRSSALAFASNNDLHASVYAERPIRTQVHLCTTQTMQGSAWTQPPGTLMLGKLLVTNQAGTMPPDQLETGVIRIRVIANTPEAAVLVDTSVVGRAGMNTWYEQNVGYKPDEEHYQRNPRHLLNQVAEMVYRDATGDAN